MAHFEANVGGEALLINGNVEVDDSMFVNNDGRGLTADGSGLMFVTSSQFIGNTASGVVDDSGGAVEVTGNAVINFTDILFEGNTAFERGGAIWVHGFADEPAIRLWNVRILNNTAADGGGAISIGQHCQVNFDNVAISGNTCGTNGGAIEIYDNLVTGKMRHLSIYNNSAGGLGDGFYVSTYNPITLINNVIWDNADGNDFVGADNVTITHTCCHDYLNIDATNQIVLSSPWDIGVGGELFLSQAPANLCVGTGDDAEANSSFGAWQADWTALTTAKNSMLDMPAVDMGFHYAP